MNLATDPKVGDLWKLSSSRLENWITMIITRITADEIFVFYVSHIDDDILVHDRHHGSYTQHQFHELVNNNTLRLVNRA